MNWTMHTKLFRSQDLHAILEWTENNLVWFDISKMQSFIPSNKKSNYADPVVMNGVRFGETSIR